MGAAGPLGRPPWRPPVSHTGALPPGSWGKGKPSLQTQQSLPGGLSTTQMKRHSQPGPPFPPPGGLPPHGATARFPLEGPQREPRAWTANHTPPGQTWLAHLYGLPMPCWASEPFTFSTSGGWKSSVGRRQQIRIVFIYTLL